MLSVPVTTTLSDEKEETLDKLKKRAASKILFWYRSRKSKLNKPFIFAINELKFANDDDLRNRQYDVLVDHCIEHCRIFKNRAGLQLLGYTLFSGNRSLSPAGNYFYCLLLLLLHDPQSNITDISKALKDTFTDWYHRSKEDLGSFPIKREQSSRLSGFWGSHKMKPDDLVSISHGGGFYHIVDFLRNRTLGYPLQGLGLGIQVSPNSTEKDLHYANWKSVFHCDLPATLQAEIPAKYLDPCDRNGYEAGLRPEYIPFLRNMTVEIHKPLWLGNLNIVLDTCYPNEPEFKKRVLKSAENVKNVFHQAQIESCQYSRR